MLDYKQIILEADILVQDIQILTQDRKRRYYDFRNSYRGGSQINVQLFTVLRSMNCKTCVSFCEKKQAYIIKYHLCNFAYLITYYVDLL
jgi:hypothetical protein